MEVFAVLMGKGKINVAIPLDLDDAFREAIGGRRGNLAARVEEAIRLWMEAHEQGTLPPQDITPSTPDETEMIRHVLRIWRGRSHERQLIEYAIRTSIGTQEAVEAVQLNQISQRQPARLKRQKTG